VGKIIIIDGQLTINLEYGRKSINLRSANIGSLTQVRSQARDMGLLDNSRRLALQPQVRSQEEAVSSAKTSPENPEPSKTTPDFERDLDKKIEDNSGQTPELLSEEESQKYIIEIPAGTKIEQIHGLKDFLGAQDPGSTPIYILLGGNEIDTKMSVRDVEKVKEWEKQNL